MTAAREACGNTAISSKQRLHAGLFSEASFLHVYQKFPSKRLVTPLISLW